MKTIINSVSGVPEEYNSAKLFESIYANMKGINFASPFFLATKVDEQVRDNMSTNDINLLVSRSAEELVTVNMPGYDLVAAKYLLEDLYKRLDRSLVPMISFKEFVKFMITKGFYNKRMKSYSDFDLDKLDEYIDHNNDKTMCLSAVKTFLTKYLVQDRTTNVHYESPQFAMMAVVMNIFADQSDKIEKCKKAYDMLNKKEFSFPTQIMVASRTKSNQMANCVLMDMGDSMGSISEIVSSILKYVTQGAGLGINIGRIRPLNSKVRGGQVKHAGITLFLKLIEAAVNSCSQGGHRKGSATCFFPIWHTEAETILQLRKANALEVNRVRGLNYGIQINKFLWKKILTEEYITLLPPHSTPGLYEAFFNDQDEFAKLYDEYSTNPQILEKRVVKTEVILNLLAKEIFGTGSYYLHFVDNTNVHGPYDEHQSPIFISNLCVTGDSLINTKNGMYTVKELYDSQEDFEAVVDVRTEGNLNVKDKGTVLRTTNKMHLTATNSKIFKVTLSNGLELRSTEWHKYYVVDKDSTNKKVEKLQLNQLDITKHKLLVQSEEGSFSDNGSFEEGYLVGHVMGDGTITNGRVIAKFWDDDVTASWFEANILEKLKVNNIDLEWKRRSYSYRNSEIDLFHGKLLSQTFKKFLDSKNPDNYNVLLKQSRSFQLGFIKGLLDSDGTSYETRYSGEKFTFGIQITQTRRNLLKTLQIMLQNFGIVSNLGNEKKVRSFPDIWNGTDKVFECKPQSRLDIASKNTILLIEKIKSISPSLELFSKPAKAEKLNTRISRRNDMFDTPLKDQSYTISIKSIEEDGFEDVYDTTQEFSNSLIFNGIVTGNCMEILQPTKPLKHEKDAGLVATCTLAAHNLGTIGRIVDMSREEKVAHLTTVLKEKSEVLVEALDNILDAQSYPIKQAEMFTNLYRNLGIGASNFAYLLALNDITYDDEAAFELTHNVFEAVQYFLLKASVKLSKERGPAPNFSHTKYSQKLLPTDWYCKTLDNFVDVDKYQYLLFDWEELREEISKYGLRNCTLTAYMPTETSSQIIGATSGLDPLRSIVATKKSGSTHHKQIAPDANTLKYKTFIELKDNVNLIKIMGIVQKWTDQSISTNIMYKYKNNILETLKNSIDGKDSQVNIEELKLSELTNDLTLAQLVGLKTIYYINVEGGMEDSSVAEEECSGCVS